MESVRGRWHKKLCGLASDLKVVAAEPSITSPANGIYFAGMIEGSRASPWLLAIKPALPGFVRESSQAGRCCPQGAGAGAEHVVGNYPDIGT